MIAGNRKTGRMDLGETWIGKIRTFFVRTPGSSDVTAGSICGKIKYVCVSAGTENNRLTSVRLDFTVDQISRDDSARRAVDRHQFKHFVPRIHRDLADTDLPAKGTVGTQ